MGKLAIAGVIFIALLFVWYAKDLPTPGKIKERQAPEATRIYDRNGQLLYSVAGEQNRVSVSLQDMPDYLKEATIAAEDKDFYKHYGLDFRGIARAIVYDVLHLKRGQGGSTITQQYVKNAMLDPRKTFARKIKELILTIEIETMFSKDQILEMYLNEIPYGSTAYGVQSASKLYFNKDVKELDLAQSAMLAALPQAPTYYSPYGSHPKEREARKNYVLDRMANLEMISKDEAEAAKKEKLVFSPKRESITAPHFIMYVKEKLIDDYGEKMVEEGGLKVTTTLDLDNQKAAEEAVAHGGAANLKKNGATNAALAAIDPKNGDILAMVGSVDYFNNEIDGQVNVTVANRQPGSSIKPIVYASAFQKDYNPAFVLFDVPTNFGGGYQPQNYDGTFRGPVTMREALGNSLNIPAVKTLALTGLNDAVKQARAMGITTLTDPNRYGLAFVLGGAEVKPLEMATAFGVFADNGKLAYTHAILKVEDNKGKTLYEYKPEDHEPKEVLNNQIAYQISSILSDNGARSAIFGSNSSLYFPNRQVAVKTGTTSEYRDAWTIGYTPSISVAVWVGNNDNTPMSGHAAGAMAAAPIFHEFIDRALSGKANENFVWPDGLQDVAVDKLSNKLPGEFSPETITDLFASWQVPSEKDDIHIKVKVNKLNGKLATDKTPPELVEEKIVANLHSEMPGNSNWETPVIAWAQANNYPMMPTEKDEGNEDYAKLKPTIVLMYPQIGQEISASGTANFQVGVLPGENAQITKVEFFIDNVLIGTTNGPPWNISYDQGKISRGDHEIKAIATNSLGLISTASGKIRTK